MDLLVISYALVLIFHPEYMLMTRYPDLRLPASKEHQSDIIPFPTVETNRSETASAENLTTGFISNTSSLRNVCWNNCGVLHLVDYLTDLYLLYPAP